MCDRGHWAFGFELYPQDVDVHDEVSSASEDRGIGNNSERDSKFAIG